MQKFLLLLVITGLLVFLLGKFIPFWGLITAVALISYFIAYHPGLSFLASGLGFGLVWFFLVIRILIVTNSELPVHMAELMGMPNDNILWFGTSLIGFIIGGFSGLTGALLRRLFERKYEGVYRK